MKRPCPFFQFRIIVFSLILFFAGGSIRAEEFPSPTIGVNPDIYYPLDEILYLEGSAKPNSTVQIQFQAQGGKPIRVITKSDQKGEWVFAQKLSLEVGIWEVRARMVEGDLASEWSNPRVMKVVMTGVVIGGIAVKFAALFSIVVLLLLIGIAGAFYYTRRISRMRAEFAEALREKEREALGVEVEQDFSELRQKIMRELEHSEGRLAGGGLTRKKESTASICCVN